MAGRLRLNVLGSFIAPRRCLWTVITPRPSSLATDFLTAVRFRPDPARTKHLRLSIPPAICPIDMSSLNAGLFHVIVRAAMHRSVGKSFPNAPGPYRTKKISASVALLNGVYRPSDDAEFIRAV